jgi:glycosyltransferase involved in cell wall biosynthesis
MRLPSLSIAIASYNDAESIGPLVDEAARVAAELAAEFRILVVDDGSKDESAARIRALAADRPWLECRYHERNLGFGPTFGELYRFDACEFNAILPGDGQIPPAEVARMAAAIGGADVVLGVRRLRRDSFRRRLNSFVYNAAVACAAGRRVHDVNSISLARTALVRRMTLHAKSAFIHAEFLLECHRNGGRVKAVEIEHRPREHGAGHGGRLSVIAPTVKELGAYVLRHGPLCGLRPSRATPPPSPTAVPPR